MKSFQSSIVTLVILTLSSFAYGDYPSAKLTKAVAWKESKNTNGLIGDKHLANHAYGFLQVRKTSTDDVNQKFGTHYTASECLKNRKLSLWIFREYINMYATRGFVGHKPTDQDKARIWNGGPNGFKKASTISYWGDVREIAKSL